MTGHANRHGHQSPIHPMLDTFRLVAETHKQALRIAETARDAVKSFYRDPADLVAFIERHGTPVYVLNRPLLANFCLWALGFEPGFIPPSVGRRYGLLQKALGLLALLDFNGSSGDKVDCHFAHGVFVMPRSLFTVGYLSHQLHHWLAFKSGMKGYTERSQELYHKFWNEQKGVLGREVYDMSAEDMMALKAAINRDMEALKFLRDIAGEILIPAKRATRFNTGGKTSA